ncbi:unnamed protein product [Mytilus coruscus]|uniref:Integrase catalytic domain-containing protein n=1 Tax=Mytilus coruscus TaxID=42192 RepID=A0A6J8ELF2_MYTCO|nr:unnamed protein product [Mytilus coruscus]
MQIHDIFLLFGAPNIIQSDNGAEFTANIISELKKLWPECKPQHPRSQGRVGRANADVKDMVITWMRDNHCKDWPVGVKFVQFEKNRSHHHSGINRAPYKGDSNLKQLVPMFEYPVRTMCIPGAKVQNDRKEFYSQLMSAMKAENPDQIVLHLGSNDVFGDVESTLRYGVLKKTNTKIYTGSQLSICAHPLKSPLRV